MSQRPSLTRSLVLVWRTLRSMRTALILLLMLGLASVAGSLIPQWPNTPERVLQYRSDHPIWGSLFSRIGFFDVFGSWWFVLITVLLFVSLIACLVPRTRSLMRAVRARPVQAREIDSFRLYREASVPAGPDDAVEAARTVLRRRWYRVERDGSRPRLAAEKGLGREIGSLAFHWAFILILAGVIYGKGTGFTGYAVVVEGDTWIDAAANYDGQLRTGRFFGGNFSGFGLKLESFESKYRETGQPMDFVSRVELLTPEGEPIRTQDIRVNHPAHIAGRSIYQINFGWAPVVQVRDGDRLLARDPVVMDRDVAPPGVPELAMPWRGFIKLPATEPGEPDVAIELELWPDSRAYAQFNLTGQPVAMLTYFDPIIRYQAWEGRLTTLALNELDTRAMRETGSGLLFADGTVEVSTGKQVDPEGRPPAGLTLSFPELRRYSVFQVSRDAGVPVVLAAAILILVGLIPALFTSRRKLWIRVDPDPDGGSVLRVGGFALQRGPQFEEEFDRLFGRILVAAGGARDRG
jgi:cytochrome c biogenesis protein